ncbi:4-oxocyclohexanecarboxylate desaturase II [Sinomonas cyclohexanicum]|uniref:4-oxocyclohex-2-ene-1-carboxylate 5-dehydrogenase n=1 Tax=Sinomonas cyclohexanicum TaxID=322009 RepID=CHCC2_SINCY|nr:FAD-dependent oxidoreductase [Corynebacterium cyclohexanicum]BCT75149.1 4-oxocyclohexanecarboxylate desaturase II [Corynebacterium cyclohexanicum]
MEHTVKQNKTIACDVLVVGSGAAGMAAALKAASQGLSVIVAEKEQYFGGTTAISAGWAWVPGNRVGTAAGDTREEVETYLKNLAPDTYNADGVAQFLDTVPEALDFFERETDVEFVYPEKAPDYQMDLPGARLGGRAILPKDTDARILGDKRLLMQPYMSSYTVFGYMPQVGPDINEFFHVNQSVKSFVYVAKKLLRTWFDAARYRRPVLRSNGNALMTLMVKSAYDAGVRMWKSSPVLELTRGDDGAVTGAVTGGEHPARVEAKLGVILAAGGFSGNTELRKKYFPHDAAGDDHFTPTVGHGGDAATMTLAAGGRIDDAVSSVGSWAPVTVFRFRDGRQRLFPHLRAIGLPGLIAVDRHGKRFGNEALSYHDFGGRMIAHNAGEDKTFGWVIADEKTMHKYGIGYAKPWPMPRGYFYKMGYLVKGNTLEELADRIGVDAAGLTQTVAEFNVGARAGEDPAFGRGSTEYNHFRGDMEHKPNPNLAPLDKGPYYAAKIQMGDLGTFAGIAVDSDNLVVTEEGTPIPGLLAVGAAARSVFGGGYPGYGSHIGAALVFGYRAGRDVARLASARENGRGIGRPASASVAEEAAR